MDFSELQQHWQAQAASSANSAATETALVLAEMRRLHRAGRRRNWVVTLILLLSLGSFLASWFLSEGSPSPIQAWGLVLLAITLLGLIAVMWWGTTLRRAVQPGTNSEAYIQASLRTFRFRRTIFNWLAVPYVALLGMGMLLLVWPRLHIHGSADWWKLALWMAAFVAVGLICRRVGLRRCDRAFGPAERAVGHWQAAWADDTASGN